MHWLARVFVWLVIMAVWVAVVAYAPKLTDIFDQSPEYTGYFRIGGMVAIVIGVLFVFGVIGDTSSVTDITLQ